MRPSVPPLPVMENIGGAVANISINNSSSQTTSHTNPKPNTNSAKSKTMALTATQSNPPTHKRKRKRCSHPECPKVDAGGGFCVAHGGGKKCSFAGCTKGYQTGGFCRQHGGGSRCQILGCDKVDAGKGLCRAHGGGKRCQAAGCLKADVGGGFCTSHGGGKRCQEPGCTKIDQGGGKCRAHGGVRRCRREDCQQPARGTMGFCTEHGGAKICSTPQCRRLAKESYGLLCSGCFAKQKRSLMVQTTSPLTSFTPELSPGAGAGSASGSNSGSATASACASTASVSNSPRDQQQFAFQSPFQSPFPSPLASPNQLHELSSLDLNNQFPTASSSTCLSADDLLVAAAPEQQITSASRCHGRNVQNCLLNGCRRSFGGKCNCLPRCTCDDRTPLNTAIQPVQVVPLAASQDQAAVGASSSSSAASTSWKLDATIVLRRLVIQVAGAAKPPSKANQLRALIKQLPCVRNVYVLDSDAFSSASNVKFSVWGNDTLTFELLCAVLSQFPSQQEPLHNELSQELLTSSQWAWPLKQVTLHVPAMMCINNCGTTIVKACLQHQRVHRARVLFDKRQVIVCGTMTLVELESTLEDVGFEGKFVRMVPWPRLFGFHLVFSPRPNFNDDGKLEDDQDKADQDSQIGKMQHVLQRVEGVENVKVTVQQQQVLILVAALLDDASTILNQAARYGVILQQVTLDPTVEEEYSHSLDTATNALLVNDGMGGEKSPKSQAPAQTTPPSAGPVFASARVVNPSFSLPIETTPLHLCDLELCARNGCRQYMSTLAHTAALAVGWSVAGCAMSWGGECTCDETCRCIGCPKHNPL